MYYYSFYYSTHGFDKLSWKLIEKDIVLHCWMIYILHVIMFSFTCFYRIIQIWFSLINVVCLSVCLTILYWFLLPFDTSSCWLIFWYLPNNHVMLKKTCLPLIQKIPKNSYSFLTVQLHVLIHISLPPKKGEIKSI